MRGILLDIEGTTTPVRFVYDTLFPFARRRAAAFLDERAGDPEVRDIVRALQVEHEAESASEAFDALTYVYGLMDRDRKSTALKRLQGLIWQEGYGSGELHGDVFPDVPPALERWRRSGLDVRIFSSGSVLAQKLIFSTTPFGDLTRFLKGNFDTEIGAKIDAASYTRIAHAFALPPSEIVFVSDVVRELDAARAAGVQTLLAVRPGNAPQGYSSHQMITTFEDLG
jgi:enolase-phosphatase E1